MITIFIVVADAFFTQHPAASAAPVEAKALICTHIWVPLLDECELRNVQESVSIADHSSRGPASFCCQLSSRGCASAYAALLKRLPHRRCRARKPRQA